MGSAWRINLLCAGTITIVATALRLQYLDQPIRYDEAYTFLEFASRGLRNAAANYSLPNNHMLHSVLVCVTCHFLSSTELAIRLPALIGGILLVPAVYWLGTYHSTRGAGIIAAALTATSSALIEYATNARGYSIVALLTVIAALIAVFLSRHPDRIPGWMLLAVVGALGLYTIPIMLYPIGGIFAWLLICLVTAKGSCRAQPHHLLLLFSSISLTLGLSMLLYAPALLFSGVERVVANRFVAPADISSIPHDLQALAAATLAHWTRDLSAAAAGVLVVGAVGYLRPPWKQAPGTVPMALPIFGFFALTVLCMRKVPEWPRVVLFFLPVVFVWTASGFERLRHQVPVGWLRGQAALIGATCSILVFGSYRVLSSGAVASSTETGVLPDAHAIAHELGRILQPGDVVLAYLPCDEPLRFYLRMHGLPENGLNPAQAALDANVFVVVSKIARQTVPGVCQRLGFSDRVDLTTAVLLRDYPTAALYVVPGAAPGPTAGSDIGWTALR